MVSFGGLHCFSGCIRDFILAVPLDTCPSVCLSVLSETEKLRPVTIGTNSGVGKPDFPNFMVTIEEGSEVLYLTKIFHELECAVLLLDVFTAPAIVASVTFLSSKQCENWKQNDSLVTGYPHPVTADGNNSISKYGTCSSNMNNIWSSPPSTQICEAEKLRRSMVSHS